MTVHPVERLLQGAEFLTSAQHLGQCPPDEGAEIAFAGRSNAGKSSAINRLCSRKALARTSKTPGRTRLLNFFRLDDTRRLVDLPGYGYAKVDKATREQWQRDLDGYLAERQSLIGVILLMDVRHPLKDFDRMIIDWAGAAGMPLHILLTKADKLSWGAASKELQAVIKALRQHPAPLSAQLFSATNGRGCEQAWDLIGQWLNWPEELGDGSGNGPAADSDD